MEKTQVKKLVGLINFYPFKEVKIETKLRLSIDGNSSILILEQTEFLNDAGEDWKEIETRKVIIDESQYEDFCELIDLGLTYIQKSI